MTYAARVSALRADLAHHRRAASGAIPDDYGLWLAVQGAGVPVRVGRRLRARYRHVLYDGARRYLLLSQRRTRQLVTSLPSRCTHLDLSSGLSPGVDWEDVANSLAR
jgi:hypothetical protein